MMTRSFAAVVLVLAGCSADRKWTESSAALSTNTPASNIGYSYSPVTAPASGLTATNVQDAINQSTAVGYNAPAIAKQYTDQQIAAETAAFQQGNSTTLASARAYTDQQVAGEAAARQAADGAETNARLAADSAEAGARQAAIDAESGQRLLGDQSTLSSAGQYTDAQVAAAAGTTLASAKQYTDQQVAAVAGAASGANVAPFGYGSTQVGCSCQNGSCTGFCASNTGSNPDTTKRSAQIAYVSHLSFFDSDHVIVELCNSQSAGCYDIDVPAGIPVNQELAHPLAVDSMSVLCGGSCDHPFTYGVFGSYANSGARAADQMPFGTGSVQTECSCTGGVCVGFCDNNSPDGFLAMRAPAMLNLTSFSLRDDDGVLVDFCNSQTSSCFSVLVPAGQTINQQFDHPVQADTMSAQCLAGSCNGAPLTYSVAGYD
jgi:hypothetical protein